MTTLFAALIVRDGTVLGRCMAQHRHQEFVGGTRACFHDPSMNRTYGEVATHYGAAIVPARPYKPGDKAKVEVGVQVVQRWIRARLRGRGAFVSLVIQTDDDYGIFRGILSLEAVSQM